MPDSVNLTIDDKPISVPAGTLVVDAARAAGIEIPVFCSHPKLHPVGVCRMCMVEYVTPRGSRVDVSCTVPVTEGMVVRTNTPAVKAAREGVLTFLLINHPLDCPICDKGGECPLQDQTLQYGPASSKFVEPKVHKTKHHPVSDLIMLDQERCVLCWRCTRYLAEWEDKPQLGLFQRGDRTTIGTFPGQPLDAHTSGSVIDICPVGALTDRTARFGYRPWELTKTPSICTLCAVGCNIRLDERSHELRRVVAHQNDAVNGTWICDKGRFAHGFVDDEGRLQTPLVRENGGLRPATWDEALSRAAARLNAVAGAHGAKAVGGVASGRLSNEAAYLFQKFFRTLVGTNNIDFPTGSAVTTTPTGLSDVAEVGQSDLLVLVGLDANETAPVLDLSIKAAAKGGAKIIVINTRRTEAARYPGAYLPARPGAEAHVLAGLAAAILARRESGARRQPNANDEWAWARRFTSETTEAGSGVPAAALGEAAGLLAAAQRPLFLYGPQAATGPRGRAMVAALNALAGLLGQGDRVAYIAAEANSQGSRDMGLLPNTLPGQQPVTEAAVRERLGRLWGTPPPAEPGLSYAEMVCGGVRALWVAGANPATDPVVAAELGRLDCLIVQDMFLTETAQLAEVVLPAASPAEVEGTYTNLTRRVQRAPAALKAIGQSRADWAILAGLAACWQAEQSGAEAVPEAEVPDWKRKRRPTKAARGGTGAKAWNYPTAAAVLDEIGRAVPYYAPFRWDNLGGAGSQWPASALTRPLRRIEPLDPAVTAVPAPANGKYWLHSAPVLWDGAALMQHSHPLTQRRIVSPSAALNPATLAVAKLAEGTTIKLTSPRGSVTLPACADETVPPGVIYVPLGLAGAPAETLGSAGETGAGETSAGEPVAVTISKLGA